MDYHSPHCPWQNQHEAFKDAIPIIEWVSNIEWVGGKNKNAVEQAHAWLKRFVTGPEPVGEKE